MIQLPSKFQPKQNVYVSFTDKPMSAKVTAVHFFPDSHTPDLRVKYDLEIKIAFEESTRIYNIDETFLSNTFMPESKKGIDKVTDIIIDNSKINENMKGKLFLNTKIPTHHWMVASKNDNPIPVFLNDIGNRKEGDEIEYEKVDVLGMTAYNADCVYAKIKTTNHEI
jgi:hypothetical protein